MIYMTYWYWSVKALALALLLFVQALQCVTDYQQFLVLHTLWRGADAR